MIPRILIDTAEIPGESKKLSLYRHGSEFSIRIGTQELMNSRANGSEKALAELACQRLSDQARVNVLIGGLGMGFTLAAALNELGPTSELVVAELVPGVIEWNRGPLAELAGVPLKDGRVTVREIDVGEIMSEKPEAYDAIILDVDNGPAGLTRRNNDRLYSKEGLSTAFSALRPGGVLAVWSAGQDPAFSKRLRKAGFEVEELRIRANRTRGARQIIWLASKVEPASRAPYGRESRQGRGKRRNR
jgi:spermidine synthase